jgi:hypothetical protein
MGDNINISDVSGANINIKSTLENVKQTINALPGDQTTKDELRSLLEQLSVELQKAPTGHAQEVEQVAKRAEASITEASKPQPDKEDVQYSLERLQKAATNLSAVIPTILPIATRIVEHIQSIIR